MASHHHRTHTRHVHVQHSGSDFEKKLLEVPDGVPIFRRDNKVLEVHSFVTDTPSSRDELLSA